MCSIIVVQKPWAAGVQGTPFFSKRGRSGKNTLSIECHDLFHVISNRKNLPKNDLIYTN